MTAPVRSQAAKLHRFDEILVKTEQLPNGEFVALDAEYYGIEFPVVGWGFSRFMAIADLFDKMPRAASDREERNRFADQCDHNRDLRKAL